MACVIGVPERSMLVSDAGNNAPMASLTYQWDE
jgi:hypothetical protein